jgi:hypothetical protein
MHNWVLQDASNDDMNANTQTHKVRNWVRDVVPKVAKGKPVTIGTYAYLDGELHVRVNLACDAIMEG